MQPIYVLIFLFATILWIRNVRGDRDDGNSTLLNCPGRCMNDANTYTFTCINSGCEQFPVELIQNKNYVTFIDVSFNAITTVPLLPYPKLTYLDLSNNAITKILESTFKDCPQIQYLNLSANVLTIITSVMFKMDLGNTIELDLSNNRISSIEMHTFFFMHKLTRLNISHNNLIQINNSAINQVTLQILDLDGNSLTQISMNYFRDLSNLKHLSLRKNAIQFIEEDSFANTYHLQMLDLGENQLNDLRENIFHEGLRHPLSELQAIYLDKNNLKTIHDKTFSPFPKLKNISLADNKLRDIGKDQPFPESLTRINLQRNLELTKIRNGTFSNLKELKMVDISGCYKLTEIEPGAFDGEQSSVTHFDASQCGLMELSAKLLSWKNVTTLDLSGNPWDCDCDISWTKSTLPEDILLSMQCSTPHQLKGHVLDEIDVDTMSCTFYSRYKHNISIGLLMAATAVLTLCAIGLIYSYRKKIFRKKGIVKRGTYQTLYNTADDSADPTVSIQMDEATSDTKLLDDTEPTAV